MRVLVTGVAGFVGSHLAERLIADGHEVVGVDCFTDYYPRSIKEQNLSALRDADAFRFHEADLRNADLASMLEGVEVVIHEAAMAGLMRSWTDFESYVSCNLVATQRLIEAGTAAGIRRFLHVSTSSVYGTDAVGDEDTATRPVSPYGVTKLAAERLVLAHVAVHGFPAAILRYFSIYGPRQRPDMAYHIFAEALIEGRRIVIYGDGLQSRSNTYVDDAVAGTVAAIDGAAIGQIYNIGGGEEITLLDATRLIADALEVTADITHEAPRPGDQRRTVADISRATTDFGYAPKTTPAEGLSAQVEWHLRRRGEAGSGT
jgi:UDP-glucuronate 4-epimerase